MTRRHLAPLRHLLGPVLLVVIAIRIDRAAVLDALSQARLTPMFAAAAAVLVTIPVRAARWEGILARMGHGAGLLEALRLYAGGTFAGTATPGRVGELYKAAPLVRRGMPAQRALASVLLDRCFDAGAGGLVALVYFAAIGRGAAALAAVSGVLAVAIAAGFLVRLRGRFAIVPFAAIAMPASLVRAAVLTAVASAWAWSANHLLVRSLGLPLGPLETAGISATAALASLLPVSMLGIGTRDAALLVLLARYGIAASDAVALSTLFLLLNIWTGLACGLAALVPPRPSRTEDEP